MQQHSHLVVLCPVPDTKLIKVFSGDHLLLMMLSKNVSLMELMWQFIANRQQLVLLARLLGHLYSPAFDSHFPELHEVCFVDHKK